LGHPGDYRGVDKDGIEWWNSDEYVLQEPFTVFVSSRSPLPFQQNKPNAKLNLLWMHDVNIRDTLVEIADIPDSNYRMTNWHTIICQGYTD